MHTMYKDSIPMGSNDCSKGVYTDRLRHTAAPMRYNCVLLLPYHLVGADNLLDQPFDSVGDR